MNENKYSELITWLDALEFYARDWDATFEGRPSYFTQEFWYMLMNCVRAYWLKNPMTVSQLAQCMKIGSNRTREERIKRAVSDGYLVKTKGEEDGWVNPTFSWSISVWPGLRHRDPARCETRHDHYRRLRQCRARCTPSLSSSLSGCHCRYSR